MNEINFNNTANIGNCNNSSFSSNVVNDYLISPEKINKENRDNVENSKSTTILHEIWNKYDDIYNQPNKMFSLGVLYEEKQQFTNNDKKQQEIEEMINNGNFDLFYYKQVISDELTHELELLNKLRNSDIITNIKEILERRIKKRIELINEEVKDDMITLSFIEDIKDIKNFKDEKEIKDYVEEEKNENLTKRTDANIIYKNDIIKLIPDNNSFISNDYGYKNNKQNNDIEITFENKEDNKENNINKLLQEYLKVREYFIKYEINYNKDDLDNKINTLKTTLKIANNDVSISNISRIGVPDLTPEYIYGSKKERDDKFQTILNLLREELNDYTNELNQENMKESALSCFNVLYNNIWTPAPEFKIDKINPTANTNATTEDELIHDTSIKDNIPTNSLLIKISLGSFKPTLDSKFRIFIDGIIDSYFELDNHSQNKYEELIRLTSVKFLNINNNRILVENITKKQVVSSYTLELNNLKNCNNINEEVFYKSKEDQDGSSIKFNIQIRTPINNIVNATSKANYEQKDCLTIKKIFPPFKNDGYREYETLNKYLKSLKSNNHFKNLDIISFENIECNENCSYNSFLKENNNEDIYNKTNNVRNKYKDNGIIISILKSQSCQSLTKFKKSILLNINNNNVDDENENRYTKANNKNIDNKSMKNKNVIFKSASYDNLFKHSQHNIFNNYYCSNILTKYIRRSLFKNLFSIDVLLSYKKQLENNNYIFDNDILETERGINNEEIVLNKGVKNNKIKNEYNSVILITEKLDNLINSNEDNMKVISNNKKYKKFLNEALSLEKELLKIYTIYSNKQINTIIKERVNLINEEIECLTSNRKI